MAIRRDVASAILAQLNALPLPYGMQTEAWTLAACNVLVSADDEEQARRAMADLVNAHYERPTPAAIRNALEALRPQRAQVADGAWLNCSCNRGWVHVCSWYKGVPYYASGKCRACQSNGAVDPSRMWEGYP
jgi:hypothetical protein